MKKIILGEKKVIKELATEYEIKNREFVYEEPENGNHGIFTVIQGGKSTWKNPLWVEAWKRPKSFFFDVLMLFPAREMELGG